MSAAAYSERVENAPASALPAAAGSPVGAAAVRRLDLTEFRNYRALRLYVAPPPVILIGANGAGKTNLLEALSFLAPGRGLRRAALGEVTRKAAGEAAGGWAVAARLDTPAGEITLGSGLENAGRTDQTGRRAVRVDGQPARGQAALAEHLSVIWLTPEMDRLFQDGASGRRRFVDRMVLGFDPEHASRLADYERALRSRQRLLRDGTNDPAWLTVLEETMAEAGVAVAAARREAVARLASALIASHGATGQPFPRAELTLAGDVETWLGEGPALQAEDRLREALSGARRSDGASGRTEHGPHRSDLLVTHADKAMAAAQCSTGEQKALLISIVLAHAQLLRLDRDAAPLLLLDEVAAHLDDDRRHALAARIIDLGAQAWLTGTDDSLFSGFRGHALFLRVADGAITPMAN